VEEGAEDGELLETVVGMGTGCNLEGEGEGEIGVPWSWWLGNDEGVDEDEGGFDDDEEDGY
jgi:hypothetical protein